MRKKEGERREAVRTEGKDAGMRHEGSEKRNLEEGEGGALFETSHTAASSIIITRHHCVFACD